MKDDDQRRRRRDENDNDVFRRGGTTMLSKEGFEFAFVSTVRNGARFQDDGLNGDDDVSTTDDDLRF
jgi:hypothetical protein